jgi:hypothetical protein
MEKAKMLSLFGTFTTATGIAVGFSLVTTSCSIAPDMQKHISYIAQREFSISAYSDGNVHQGSGTA